MLTNCWAWQKYCWGLSPRPDFGRRGLLGWGKGGKKCLLEGGRGVNCDIPSPMYTYALGVSLIYLDEPVLMAMPKPFLIDLTIIIVFKSEWKDIANRLPFLPATISSLSHPSKGFTIGRSFIDLDLLVS